MSVYLQPIRDPESDYRVRIQRFNPNTDAAPRWEVYTVPHVRSMTVIQSLEYLWDQNVYVAFRANCREMTCGSCAMLINGRPGLACMTVLEDGTELEPLGQYPVLRDLIPDTSSVEEKYKQLKLWPHPARGAPIDSVSGAVMQAYQHTYSRCIECNACLEICPQSDARSTQFDGPMFMVQLARVGQHPLDGVDRNRQSIERGAFSCINCYECADVCPVHLNPAQEIGRLRWSGLLAEFADQLGRLVGRAAEVR